MSDVQDREIEEIRKNGYELVTLLFGVFKTLKAFDLNNKNAQGMLSRLKALLDPFFSFADTITVQLVGNQFFINQKKIVVGMAGYAAVDKCAGLLATRGVGTLELSRGLTDENIVKFSKAIMDFTPSTGAASKPFEEFSKRFEQAQISGIEIRKLISDDEAGGAGAVEDDRGPEESSSYLDTITIVLKVFESVISHKKLNMKLAKRAVQKLVGVIEEHKEGIVTLLKIADLGNYLAQHSVNVAVYAIMIGSKLNLPKAGLGELGLCGLFHDLGMLTVPPEARMRKGPLGTDDWNAVWRHPAEGAKMLLKNERVAEAVTRAMQVAFEHQMRKDDAGYPRLDGPRKLDLFTRIVKVADAFDAATSDRPYRPARSDAEALQEMLSPTETVYERLFVKMLANALGVYPVGASVKLNTGEVGTVYRENPSPDYKDKPVIRVYADAHGRKIDKLLNLMEKEGGVFKYWIVPFDEQEVNIDVSGFISIV